MSKNNGKAMIAIVLSVTAMVVALLSWIATLSARARPAVHDDLEARPATGPIGMMEKKETEDRRVESKRESRSPLRLWRMRWKPIRLRMDAPQHRIKRFRPKTGKPTSRFSQIVKKIAKHV